MLGAEVAERSALAVSVGEGPPRGAIEPEDLEQKPVVGGADERTPIGEQALEVSRAVLEPGRRVGHAEGHVRIAAREADLVKQPDEQGIGSVVVDDKARVDRQRAVGRVKLVGVRVAAEARRALKEQDVVLAREEPGRAEAGDPAPDDGDPTHTASSASSSGNGRRSRAMRNQERIRNT